MHAYLDLIASWKNCRMAGPERSSYTPWLALSLTVTTPKRAKSPTEPSSLPPSSGGAWEDMLDAQITAMAPWSPEG